MFKKETINTWPAERCRMAFLKLEEQGRVEGIGKSTVQFN